MANKYNQPREFPSKGHKTGCGKATHNPGRDGTAAWPGLPGKTQGKSRDKSGTKKLRQSPKEIGI